MVKNPLIRLFSVALLSLSVSSTYAAQVEGVDFPDELKVGSKTLVLNGTGVRSATMFNVKVYAAGLYLDKKSDKEAEILDSAQPKVVKMAFLRDVKKSQLNEAWDKGVQSACGSHCEQVKPQTEQLKNMMTEMKKGNTLEFTIQPAQVEVKINDKKAGEISGEHFSKALLGTWLGPKPPTEELKKGLLGKK